ncbi:MAG: rhodanese-like domain-containing protein [Bacteroidetes bacterium]|nr:rhodanese-like domain-containing protein [Bacteroidota bacterium]
MKHFFYLLFFAFVTFSACSSDSNSKGYADLDLAGFKAKMAEPNTVILDVRTPAETAEGMIDGAIEIDYEADNFETQVDKLDKEKTYLVYCKSGGRSSEACDIMANKGFKNLYSLKGGYTAWREK